MNSSTPTAVIDLGTNTFHLLIANVGPDDFLTELYRERIFVKLASDGIETIGPAPYTRGLEAMVHFRKILDDYRVTTLHAIGTAALRRASNGAAFIKSVSEQAAINVQLIDGDEEARLITRGVLAAIPQDDERCLIMDIGGGSTEFIITHHKQVLWRRSFPVGISVLYQKFHRTDPIGATDVRELTEYLTEITQPLRTALQRYPAHHLAGAAGTFDVLATMLRDDAAPAHPTSHQLALTGFPAIYQRVINSYAEERASIPDLPAQRVDMIVVAMLLINFTLRLAQIRRVTVSDWAMKEGILLDNFSGPSASSGGAANAGAK